MSDSVLVVTLAGSQAFSSIPFPTHVGMRNPQEAWQTQKTTGAQQEMERREHPWMRQ